MVNFSINNGRNVLKVNASQKDLKEQTLMLINPTSHNLKRMTRLIQSESQKRCTHETNDLL